MTPILMIDSLNRQHFLADAISCKVVEERNGIYELTMTYPMSGQGYADIAVDKLIKAKPNKTDGNQLFRIYSISKPLNGIITVNAEHISYGLANYPVTNISLTSASANSAINAVLSSAVANSPESNVFPFSQSASDIATTHDFAKKVGSARSALGGSEGSILDTFGGEWYWNNYTIKLCAARGADNGVVISYRKNLSSVKLDISAEEAYTALFPYAIKDDVLYTITDKYISVENVSGLTEEKILLHDFSSEFKNDEEITPATLLTKATEWLEDNDINSFTVSVEVGFVDLSEAAEYSDYSALETVSLCDIVTVKHIPLGIDIKAKVVKTEFDVLAERYDKIDLGKSSGDFASTYVQNIKQIKAVKDSINTTASYIEVQYQAAILAVTQAITGQSGGHVITNPAENPQELLIIDTDDINTAQKVWRWNSAGLGYSSTGYNGTYATAITADGKIVADFIATGTLNSSVLAAGSITTDKLAAGAVTAEKLSVGFGNGDNMLFNSSFENTLTVPDNGSNTFGWVGTALAPYQSSIWNTAGVDGNAAIAMIPGLTRYLRSVSVPVLEGVTYRFSYYSKTSGLSAVTLTAWVTFYNASGAYISEGGYCHTTAPSATWTRKTGVATAPSNAKFATVTFRQDAITYDGTDNPRIFVDHVMLRKGTEEVEYATNSSETQTSHTVIDSDGLTVYDGAIKVLSGGETLMSYGSATKKLEIVGSFRAVNTDTNGNRVSTLKIESNGGSGSSQSSIASYGATDDTLLGAVTFTASGAGTVALSGGAVVCGSSNSTTNASLNATGGAVSCTSAGVSAVGEVVNIIGSSRINFMLGGAVIGYIDTEGYHGTIV